MCSFSPLCLVYFINNNYYYSTLETDVCVWRYAPLVVHATQEGEEEDPSPSNADSKLLTARKKEWWLATTDSLPQVVTCQL